MKNTQSLNPLKETLEKLIQANLKKIQKVSIMDFKVILKRALEKADKDDRIKFGGVVPFYAIWQDMVDAGIGWEEFKEKIVFLTDERQIDLHHINDLSMFSHPERTFYYRTGPVGYATIRPEFEMKGKDFKNIISLLSKLFNAKIRIKIKYKGHTIVQIADRFDVWSDSPPEYLDRFEKIDDAKAFIDKRIQPAPIKEPTKEQPKEPIKEPTKEPIAPGLNIFPDYTRILPLQDNTDGNLKEVGITKVDRNRLYGIRSTKKIDEEGKVCQKAIMLLDDNKMIPENFVWVQGNEEGTKPHKLQSGKYSETLDDEGNYVPSSVTETVDAEGKVLPAFTSNLATTYEDKDTKETKLAPPQTIASISDASTISTSQLLDLKTESLYQITPIRQLDLDQEIPWSDQIIKTSRTISKNQRIISESLNQTEVDAAKRENVILKPRFDYLSLLSAVIKLEANSKLFAFKFNYTKALSQNDAVLLQKDNKFLFMCVGKRVEPTFSKLEDVIEDQLESEDIGNELSVGY